MRGSGAGRSMRSVWLSGAKLSSRVSVNVRINGFLPRHVARQFNLFTLPSQVYSSPPARRKFCPRHRVCVLPPYARPLCGARCCVIQTGLGRFLWLAILSLMGMANRI
jgi:hypothetical protein